MSSKLRVKCQKNDAGRLNWIEIYKKGRRKPLRLDFVWDANQLTREIEFSGRRQDMPSLADIMLMFNESFIERIGVVKLINLIETIETIETVDLISLITEITEIKKVRGLHWYDRNPIGVVKRYEANAVPHGLTTRWTYTVPANKKAFVETLCCNLTRVTVATAVGIVEAYISWAETAIATSYSMLKGVLFTNVIGDKDRASIGHGFILLEGHTIRGVTADASTDGTVNFHLATKITEFDA